MAELGVAELMRELIDAGHVLLVTSMDGVCHVTAGRDKVVRGEASTLEEALRQAHAAAGLGR